jgi:predicted metalloendopeptidase
MTNVQSSGIEPGQRRLNGLQTTGREYRALSQPTHATAPVKPGDDFYQYANGDWIKRANSPQPQLH